MRGLALIAALWAGGAVAQTEAPNSTQATYGNWTLACVQKTCQITTRLNLKSEDGRVTPLIEVAIGRPKEGGELRIVVQVPGDVALRAPVEVSLDGAGEGEGAAGAKPQVALVTASYFACVPGGCIADAVLDEAAVKALLAAPAMNTTFTTLAGAKRVTVPVGLNGFTDAWAALGAAGK
jgi:invasion protein IalB